MGKVKLGVGELVSLAKRRILFVLGIIGTGLLTGAYFWIRDYVGIGLAVTTGLTLIANFPSR